MKKHTICQCDNSGPSPCSEHHPGLTMTVFLCIISSMTKTFLCLNFQITHSLHLHADLPMILIFCTLPYTSKNAHRGSVLSTCMRTEILPLFLEYSTSPVQQQSNPLDFSDNQMYTVGLRTKILQYTTSPVQQHINRNAYTCYKTTTVNLYLICIKKLENVTFFCIFQYFKKLSCDLQTKS